MQPNGLDQIAMTHFTTQDAAARILDGWRYEVLDPSQGSDDFGPKELSLRLYSRYGMNDPNEHLHRPRKAGGRGGRQREDGSTPSRLVFPDAAFIYCGSREAEDEHLDRLDLWRAYGDNGEGIAITTIWSKKGLAEDRLDVLEVKYVRSDQLNERKKQAEAIQEKIDEATEANELDKASELRKKRMDLEVGYKTDDYQSEDEIRIIYYAGDQSNVVPRILRYSAESGRLRTYITRKVKVGVGRTLTGLYVTIGPRVSEYEANHWKTMADWTVRQLGLSSYRETRQSELIYIG